MENIIGLVLMGVFLLLGGLHVYWALGGRAGLAAAIPVTDRGPAFRPPRLLTLAVALGLVAFGAVALWLSHPQLAPPPLHAWLPIAGWVLVGIFFLRSVGDFRYVGFFKRVHGTLFATWDSRLYAPLCLAIALSFLFLLLK